MAVGAASRNHFLLVLREMDEKQHPGGLRRCNCNRAKYISSISFVMPRALYDGSGCTCSPCRQPEFDLISRNQLPHTLRPKMPGLLNLSVFARVVTKRRPGRSLFPMTARFPNAIMPTSMGIIQ